MMTKLTLSTEKSVIDKAKRLAAQRQTSVSAMFVQYVTALDRSSGEEDIPIGPITRKATGLINLPPQRSARQVLEEALAEKYRIGT